MAKMSFTEARVDKIKPPAKGQDQYFERLKKGLSLALYVSYGGQKTWRVLYYHNAKPRSEALGTWPGLKVEDARNKAFKFDPASSIASNESATFKDVAETWLKEYVAEKGLRSQPEMERHLTHYVYPTWEKLPILQIDREDVNKLIRGIRDDIRKSSKGTRDGVRQADAVLATVRSVMGWYEGENHKYTSPINRRVKIDQRTAKQRSRDRILNDDEIRALWKATSQLDTYGALVKVLFLVMQRREKVTTMKWTDINEDGVWTMPMEDREKGNAGTIRLPKLALDIIAKQPRIKGNSYVFAAGIGKGPFNSFSQRKDELDALLPKNMPHWVLHDLRRTARSLMPRAKVLREIAEHTMGHKIKGVEGVYDHYDYADEKSDALAALAHLVASILKGD